MKMQTKAIVASVIVLALTMSAVSGVAYSWWSDSEDATIHITTGGMDVTIPSYTIEKQIDGTADTLWGVGGTKTISGAPSNIQIGIADITPPTSSTGVNTFIVKYTATFKTTVSAKYYIGIDEMPAASGITISHNLSEGVNWNSFNNLEGTADSVGVKEVNVTITIEIDNPSFADITLKVRNYITQSANPVIYGGSTSGSTTTFEAGDNTTVTVIPEEIDLNGTTDILPASGAVKAGTHTIKVTGSDLNSVTISDLVYKSNRVSSNMDASKEDEVSYNDFAKLIISVPSGTNTVIIDGAHLYGALSISTGAANLVIKNSIINGTIFGYPTNSSIVFDHCKFDTTTSYTDVDGYHDNNADAVWYKIGNDISLTFKNCEFEGNRGIHVEAKNSNANNCNITVTGCTFNLKPHADDPSTNVEEVKKTKAIYLVNVITAPTEQKMYVTDNTLSSDAHSLVCIRNGFDGNQISLSGNTSSDGSELGVKEIREKDW